MNGAPAKGCPDHHPNGYRNLISSLGLFATQHRLRTVREAHGGLWAAIAGVTHFQGFIFTRCRIAIAQIARINRHLAELTAIAGTGHLRGCITPGSTAVHFPARTGNLQMLRATTHWSRVYRMPVAATQADGAAVLESEHRLHHAIATVFHIHPFQTPNRRITITQIARIDRNLAIVAAIAGARQLRSGIAPRAAAYHFPARSQNLQVLIVAMVNRGWHFHGWPYRIGLRHIRL